MKSRSRAIVTKEELIELLKTARRTSNDTQMNFELESAFRSLRRVPRNRVLNTENIRTFFIAYFSVGTVYYLARVANLLDQPVYAILYQTWKKFS